MGTLRFGVADPALQVAPGQPSADIRQVRADRSSELAHHVATVAALDLEQALASGYQRARLEGLHMTLLSGDDGRSHQKQDDKARPLHDVRFTSASPKAMR